jgi:hypothetical protein
VLDVLFGGLKASSVAWTSGSGSRRAKKTHKNIFKNQEISCFVKLDVLF